MNSYKVLNKQVYKAGDYSIVPIRNEDRFAIMEWRNEQIYHLRQNRLLTAEDQERYFSQIIADLFEQNTPDQILFSYLKNGICIGYGGLVHINWLDQNAEISFVMETALEEKEFQYHWCTFLSLIEQVAFFDLSLHKIYTYAFDLRPLLYNALEQTGFIKEAVLKEHCYFKDKFIDVIMHSKTCTFSLRESTKEDVRILFDWANDVAVRQSAINVSAIQWDDHVIWYNRKLKSKNSHIFILKNGYEIPLGQVRVDLVKESWEIDYSIDHNHRGKGYGHLIIALLLRKLSNGSHLRATVKSSNYPSLSVFRGLGFDEILENSMCIFSKEINGNIHNTI
ncbi:MULTISPECIES: GNAT family N-acetyltransferase [Sphingobacterium]|uniref:GNAT family N-acetyltransferase n=1 Tax=Sphingobacterium TaxID=28453 RepID=UPI00104668AB|nr:MULTISPECIES: GNAT family N-acetyltransferase [Sphingobacterium]MCW2262019.1 RimJ/RimL family protein N-acetyltransferase [Sphingobacterium kitahiroshimense]TCR13233.1 RimJ/RimL family protein N-acetyltransferase [Sphingobacterium sp. JUb78]